MFKFTYNYSILFPSGASMSKSVLPEFGTCRVQDIPSIYFLFHLFFVFMVTSGVRSPRMLAPIWETLEIGAVLDYKRSISSFVSPVASIMVAIGTPSFLNDFAVSSFPSSFPSSKAVSMTPFKSRYIFKLFS